MPSVNLVNAVPTFVSLEEHKTLVASTPASFNDIPPVLRHKEDNVVVTLNPPLDAFDGATGTLYVLTSVLVFMSSAGHGFQIEYPAITLHAVSRADSRPSIYCQLDEAYGRDVAASNEDEDDMRELNIVPQNADSLDPIFEALSQCAALHPDKLSDEDDPDDAFIDADGSNFEVFTGDEDQELSEVGRAALAHLESIIDYPASHDHSNSTADDVEGSDKDAEAQTIEPETKQLQ
ncbi:uncharacterized protein LACBIDRAFT_297232 [Laccaria bicolor S238N-H82]|uniref:Predicted protein n=1 Tax=Laccaria bicolor (strain S238N-H82 / ATCC MYA-4686) TaxID=486041 RepID=B0DAB3_LACBS|nr:uncharacterized protein LACBIDRAFT_297232 [Laccaria bicolor S238N-H82]EDR08499.1 predicted protein [Laccaria bicolor S238N-H82]|eukprot:XP_001880724.1 predicted protein [Laccaria bicolor S238N-H82]